ncbi:unnamed protein product [Urochloa humidicola]
MGADGSPSSPPAEQAAKGSASPPPAGISPPPPALQIEVGNGISSPETPTSARARATIAAAAAIAKASAKAKASVALGTSRRPVLQVERVTTKRSRLAIEGAPATPPSSALQLVKSKGFDSCTLTPLFYLHFLFT